MNIGINIRVMGPQSTAETIAQILKSAEQAGIESAWIVDHIAIPPDDAQGSDGRYLDPLATLAWMSGQTSSIKIGTSVLILPYRPALPTAKAIATIQELSGNRLLLGVGIGWMEPEFRALGVARQTRGRDADSTLKFFHECFDNDVVSPNGQPMLFRPRPARPPIYVGGSPPHAIDRALKYGDGWLPMGRLDKLVPQIKDYKERALAGRVSSEVVTFVSLDDSDEGKSRSLLDQYEQAGVTRLIVGRAYESASEWLPTIEMINKIRS